MLAHSILSVKRRLGRLLLSQTVRMLLRGSSLTGEAQHTHSAPVKASRMIMLSTFRNAREDLYVLCVVCAQDKENFTVVVTEVNSGGLLATLESLPAFLPYSLMFKGRGEDQWMSTEVSAAASWGLHG